MAPCAGARPRFGLCVASAGEVGAEQSRVPPAPPGPATCGTPASLVGLRPSRARFRPTVGASAGSPLPRCFAFLMAGRPPCPSGSPWGRPAPPSQGGRSEGRRGREPLRWGAGLPFPPPSLPPSPAEARAGCPTRGRDGAGVAGEWESKHLRAGLGAAASNGFDGAVVVCCLENLHSAPCPRGAAAPQTVAVPKYNRLAPWGEVRAGGSWAARSASCFVSDLRFRHFALLPRLGLCVGRDWRNR